ncbi:hypothetical protein [Benzoatithermus flavus]|uniref:Uncharacterized protein n=1 Tax=Benzoatithermus flavus TaxID=3108223 RepID=A0ABU8XX51_9PROT
MASAEAPQLNTQVPGYYRHMVVGSAITALDDGQIELDAKNTPPQDVQKLLARAGGRGSADAPAWLSRGGTPRRRRLPRLSESDGLLRKEGRRFLPDPGDRCHSTGGGPRLIQKIAEGSLADPAP